MSKKRTGYYGPRLYQELELTPDGPFLVSYEDRELPDNETSREYLGHVRGIKVEIDFYEDDPDEMCRETRQIDLVDLVNFVKRHADEYGYELNI